MDWHDVDRNAFATDLAEKFIAGHPEYRFDGGPDWQGGTNRASRILREGELAIIKVFCEDERRDREVFALSHWQETGWTPHLIDTEGPRLITMTFLKGRGLPRFGKALPPKIEQGARDMGTATAEMVLTPLSASEVDQAKRWYEGVSFQSYWEDIVVAAEEVIRNSDLYRGAVFSDSVRRLRKAEPYLFAAEIALYSQDASNLVYHRDGRFNGYFDLEMARLGPVWMQIGSLRGFFVTFPSIWPGFVDGYGDRLGREMSDEEFATCSACAEFLVWRYATMGGRWRGGDIPSQGNPDFPKQADRWRQIIQAIHQTLKRP